MPSKKTLLIAGGVLLAAAAAVVIGIFSSSRETSYRSILVYEMEGSAVIERASVGSIPAAENLYLESGDRVCVQPDSLLRLKLDNDKYITAEADTVFVLTAEGDDVNSKTKIQLVQGAITNEIQNPLSEGATYETITPNSVMAVRGTIYRAELADDGQGGQTTRLSCFRGKVATRPADAEESQEVLVEGGTELYVYADNTMSETAPIDFESLPSQALQVLESLEVGTEADTQDISDSSEPSVASAGQDAPKETAEPADGTAKPDETAKPAQSSAKPSSTPSAVSTQAPEKTPAATPTAEPSQTPKAVKETPSTSQDNGSSKTPQASSPASTAAPSGGNTQKEDMTGYHKVTFQSNGATFATQWVLDGRAAVCPLLMPTENGDWTYGEAAYDFSAPVTADLTLQWQSK